jgi:hypothetical protein
VEGGKELGKRALIGYFSKPKTKSFKNGGMEKIIMGYNH